MTQPLIPLGPVSILALSALCLEYVVSQVVEPLYSSIYISTEK
jgi:hypothetical protein